MYMYHNKLTSLLHVIMVDVSKSQQHFTLMLFPKRENNEGILSMPIYVAKIYCLTELNIYLVNKKSKYILHILV